MDIQTDIKWIQQELLAVEDPELIRIFKSLLSYRKKQRTQHEIDDFFKISKEDMIKRAKSSEEDIEKGNVRSLEEFRKEIEDWKKKRKAI